MWIIKKRVGLEIRIWGEDCREEGLINESKKKKKKSILAGKKEGSKADKRSRKMKGLGRTEGTREGR